MNARLKMVAVAATTTALAGFGLATTGVTDASAATKTAPQSVSPMSATRLHCQSHKAESKPVKGKVVVPSNYCYDPHTSIHTAWHDYCTKSPDSVYFGGTFGLGAGTVDFRGPCARHDMCLAAGHSHGTCDGPLYRNLKQNCAQRFSTGNPNRYKCYAVAWTYYKVVKKFG